MMDSQAERNRLLRTEDGTWTTRCPNDQAFFHNLSGAWLEAQTHYAKPVSSYLGQTGPPGRPLRILDVCFGLGYGTFSVALALHAANQLKHGLQLVGLEIDASLAKLWPKIWNQDAVQSSGGLGWSLELSSESNASCSLALKSKDGSPPSDPLVSGHVQFGDFRKALADIDGDFDIILHDPFSPLRCPEFWTLEIMQHFHRLLAARAGCLVTYSTAAAVLGGLQRAGFSLYRTEPLGVQRGGTMAAVHPWTGSLPTGLSSLPAQDIDLLRSRSAIPYRDATLRANSQTVSRERNIAARNSQLPGRARESKPWEA